jgi:hypothetical protein
MYLSDGALHIAELLSHQNTTTETLHHSISTNWIISSSGSPKGRAPYHTFTCLPQNIRDRHSDSRSCSYPQYVPLLRPSSTLLESPVCFLQTQIFPILQLIDSSKLANPVHCGGPLILSSDHNTVTAWIPSKVWNTHTGARHASRWSTLRWHISPTILRHTLNNGMSQNITTSPPGNVELIDVQTRWW